MADIPRELGSLISIDAAGFIRMVSHEAAHEAAQNVIDDHVKNCPHVAQMEQKVQAVDSESNARDAKLKADVQIKLWKLIALMAGSGLVSGGLVKTLLSGI